MWKVNVTWNSGPGRKWTLPGGSSILRSQCFQSLIIRINHNVGHGGTYTCSSCKQNRYTGIWFDTWSLPLQDSPYQIIQQYFLLLPKGLNNSYFFQTFLTSQKMLRDWWGIDDLIMFLPSYHFSTFSIYRKNRISRYICQLVCFCLSKCSSPCSLVDSWVWFVWKSKTFS